MRTEPIPGLAALLTLTRRPPVRNTLALFGVLVVVAGAIWSVTNLDFKWSDLSVAMLAVNALILTPISSLIASLSFQITAKACGKIVSTRSGLIIVSSANVAELLPLPGGAFVRGAALVQVGAGVKDATRLVLLTAILTMGLVVSVSAAALSLLTGLGWLWLFAATTAGTLGVIFVLLRRVRASIVAAMVAVRLTELLVTSARLIVAFATFNASIGWIEAALYAVAPTLGAAAGIVPAGLGVNEAIAAGLATLIASSSALAFLSVALNRTLSLVGGAVILVVTGIWQRTSRSSE